MTEKRKVGRPRTVANERRWAPWESPAITAELDEILKALEAPPIDAEARGVFQRALFNRKYIGGDARGQIVMVCRCILESTGNENAFVGPVVRAVHLVMTPSLMERGLALIEAFDSLPLLSIVETMRSLDLFSEKLLAHYLAIAIRNKLAAMLEPDKPMGKPAKPKVRWRRPKVGKTSSRAARPMALAA